MISWARHYHNCVKISSICARYYHAPVKHHAQFKISLCPGKILSLSWQDIIMPLGEILSRLLARLLSHSGQGIIIFWTRYCHALVKTVSWSSPKIKKKKRFSFSGQDTIHGLIAKALPPSIYRVCCSSLVEIFSSVEPVP